MLADIIRRIVPINIRQDVGLWTATQASRSKLLAYPYFFMLCGQIPKNLKLLSNGECSVTYNGIEIVASRDAIFTFIEVLQHDIYEKYWTPKSTDVVLDVGAYVGMFSVKVAPMVKKVIAIEPSSCNYAYLCQNVAYLWNVATVCMAASNECGTAKLYLSGASACHTLNDRHKRYETVLTNTLDNIVSILGYERVDFIKIDAEGAELKILEGAERLLKGQVKLAIAAYHNLENGEPEKPSLLQFLLSRGLSFKEERDYIYADTRKVV